MQADGPKIRRRRETSGYGLRRFADVVDVSPAHLSRIERDLSNPQPEVMARIAQGLGCTVTDIERNRLETTSEHDEHRLAVHDHEGTRGPHPQDP